jgi:hypothetical protein
MVIKTLVTFNLTFFLLMAIGASGQGNTKFCSAPEFQQFDFWIGDWELTWKNQQGQSVTGSNRIEKFLDGCVVYENFAAPGNFIGKSWSIYRPLSHEWQQTWVDNNGGTFFLKGNFTNNEMILNTDKIVTRQGEFFYRMRFINIKENSFDWHWESSKDGATWNLNWHIHYERKQR